MILRDIVAQQERMLAGRTGQVDKLTIRARLSDTVVTDLASQANARLSALATSNQGLIAANQRLSAENDRLRGRTWAGRLWRKAERPLAVLGAVTLFFVVPNLP